MDKILIKDMVMKNVFKTIGVVALLLVVYFVFQSVLTVIPLVAYYIKDYATGAVSMEELTSMTSVSAGGAMPPAAVTALAWGLFLSTIAMLLFLHFTRFYRFERSMFSVPRRPLVLSVLLVFASMFSLNVLVQCFSLDNLLEVQFDQLSHTFIGAIAISVFGPLLEEALFRGAIQGYMMRHFKPWTAIVCSALIFGLAHMNPVQIVYATLLGVVFGWIYYRTGSLLPVILGHVLNNSVAIITMLLGMEQDSNAPLSDIEKTYMAVVFVVATVVAVQLVRMLNRSLPKVSAMAENECTE